MKRHNSTSRVRLQWLPIAVIYILCISCLPDTEVRSFTMTYGGGPLYRSYEFSVDMDGTANFLSSVPPSDRSKPRDSFDSQDRKRFKAKISAEQFAFLRSAFTKSEFRSMGGSSMDDTSTGGDLTNITAGFGTEKIAVSSQHGNKGPAFDSLKAAIEKVIDQLEWTEVTK